MVPVHAQERKEAFHEPQRRAGILPATIGNADGTEALALARSPGRLEACPTLGALRFMVPMHARKRKEAPHEPGSAGILAGALPFAPGSDHDNSRPHIDIAEVKKSFLGVRANFPPNS